jgi:hypothetical protein
MHWLYAAALEGARFLVGGLSEIRTLASKAAPNQNPRGCDISDISYFCGGYELIDRPGHVPLRNYMQSPQSLRPLPIPLPKC